MKKKILSIFVLVIINTSVFSQNNNEINFNRWSIEANVGLTKPYRNFTSGYFSSTADFFSGDIGVRYMVNEYYGFKSEFGYNKLTSSKNSSDFNTDYYRFNLQVYANIGRVLNFENWTKTFNLLVHAGAGIGHFKYENNPSEKDNVGNFIGGATGQFRLSDKISLNIDASTLVNFRHNLAFDGVTENNHNSSVIFNGTVGLSYYLGNKKIHADWYVTENMPAGVIDKQ